MPLIDSAINSMVPLMIKENHTYAEIFTSVSTYISNTLPIKKDKIIRIFIL